MKYFLGLASNYTAGDTLRHTFAIGSEYHLSELRAFLAAHYGATYDHTAVYANGRSALTVAIRAVAKRGSKVVITSLTCYAVVQAVKAAGCVPVFADVDKKTLHFGKKELEKALEGESNVQVIIVQNNLGIPADIEGIEAVAKAKKLAIIEDLAHCAGVKYADGREAGTVGRAAVLSFGKGKAIDAITGGAVVFTDPLDPPARQSEEKPEFKENFRARFYPLFAAIIRGFYNIHPRLGQYLTSALVHMHAIKRSADGKVDTKTRLTYWQCRLALMQLQSLTHRGRKPIRDFYLVNGRDELLDELEKKGFFFREIWYNIPVAPERYFHKADFHADACPVAAELAEQIVNVPTWYNQAELRPAVKMIKRYSIDRADLEEDEVSTEAPEKVDQEPEEKTVPKEDDGAPDEEVTSKKKNKSSKAKEKLTALLEKVPKKEIKLPGKPLEKKAVKKAAVKKEDPKKEKIEEPEEEKEASKSKKDENLSVLEQKSDILSASSVVEEEISDDVEELAKEASRTSSSVKLSRTSESDDAALETVSSAGMSRTPHEAFGGASARNDGPDAELPQKKAVSKDAYSNSANNDAMLPGMRVAPRKLTDREKLKKDLESGKKGGASVI